MEERWNAVDDYFGKRLIPPDPALEQALADSTAAGLPAINVTPLQGKLLAQLVRVSGSRRVLEIGTLGGYSAIWMGRAIPSDGSLVTLEINPRNAEVAQRNIERAGLTDRVRVVVGPAGEALSKMMADRVAPFDFVFIDADKENSLPYFESALWLSHKGTIIVVDNVVREGAIIDTNSADTMVRGVQLLANHLANEDRVSATAIQTVGAKGYDGFVLAVVA